MHYNPSNLSVNLNRPSTIHYPISCAFTKDLNLEDHFTNDIFRHSNVLRKVIFGACHQDLELEEAEVRALDFKFKKMKITIEAGSRKESHTQS